MQTNTRRFWPAIALLLLVMLAITGCSGRSTGDTLQGIATGAVDVVAQYMPQINLPRVTVTYDQTGVPTVFGVTMSSIAQLVPLDLRFLNLPPDTVRWLTERNVQHVELELNDAGLFIYVNGKALPYVGWNQDSLAYAGELLDRLDLIQYDATIAKAAPLLGRVGIDVVATFPVQAGVAEIPVHDRSVRAVAETPAIAEPTAIIHAVVDYSADGVPSVAGITSREIGQLAQINLRPVELPPSVVARIKSAGVNQVAVVTRSDGLHLLANERELVHLAYNEQHLMNAIDLYAQLAGDERSQVLTTFLRNIEPIFYGADINVVVEFPDGK